MSGTGRKRAGGAARLAMIVAIFVASHAAAQVGGPRPLPDKGVTTVQDAIRMLQRAHPSRLSKGPMGAVPAGDPGEWFSADNYPPAAIRAGRQGRVVVELGIDSVGAVVSCTVRESSGTTVLDDGTCAVARDRGRFNPATDARGRPIAGSYRMPVRWMLPDTPPPARDIAAVPKHESVAIQLFFSADGTMTSCRVVEKPAEGAADPCGNQRIGEKGAIVTRDGKPVSYRVTRRYAQDVEIGD